MIATIIPAGISPLPGNSRPIVSLTNKSKLPNNAANGNTCFCCVKPHLRAICGASKPKKLIPPVTEIAEAANITANSNETIRSFFTAIPTEIAVSSPNCKISNRR